jgi:hypothetical protein
MHLKCSKTYQIATYSKESLMRMIFFGNNESLLFVFCCLVLEGNKRKVVCLLFKIVFTNFEIILLRDPLHTY